MVTKPVDEEDEAEAIESQGVRDVIQAVYLELAHGNGYLPLGDLYAGIQRRGAFYLRSPATLRTIIGRMPDLHVASADTVIWIGNPQHSLLLIRLRQMTTTRTAPLPISTALVQLRRGNDRFTAVSEALLLDVAAASADFLVDNEDETIQARAEARKLAAEMLSGQELAAFTVLRRSFLSFSAAEIYRSLGRRSAPPPAFISMLEQSAVIVDCDATRFTALSHIRGASSRRAPGRQPDAAAGERLTSTEGTADAPTETANQTVMGTPSPNRSKERQTPSRAPAIPEDLAALPLFAGTAYPADAWRGHATPPRTPRRRQKRGA